MDMTETKDLLVQLQSVKVLALQKVSLGFIPEDLLWRLPNLEVRTSLFLEGTQTEAIVSIAWRQLPVWTSLPVEQLPVGQFLVGPA